MVNTELTVVLAGLDLTRNLSLKFVEMKMRAQSFLKEKVDKREKWDNFHFAQICEAILNVLIKYFLQKVETRSCFVHKRKS